MFYVIHHLFLREHLPRRNSAVFFVIYLFLYVTLLFYPVWSQNWVRITLT